MGKITHSNLIKNLQKIMRVSDDQLVPSYAVTYGLLHEYTKKNIIPLIHQREITLAIVELTTCGLISDLLTGSSGASRIFIIGIIPYSNEMKIKLGIPREDLAFGGYGVASPETAKKLSQRIKDFSGAKLGLAETGLITSSELKRKKTDKKAGEVYTAITFEEEISVKKISVQRDLKRREMRQEIAFQVLQFLESFLLNNDG
ncbi:MAG: CinA family protein [Promethearchaeota archaeon]